MRRSAALAALALAALACGGAARTAGPADEDPTAPQHNGQSVMHINYLDDFTDVWKSYPDAVCNDGSTGALSDPGRSTYGVCARACSACCTRPLRAGRGRRELHGGARQLAAWSAPSGETRARAVVAPPPLVVVRRLTAACGRAAAPFS
jgi:hypothetical protein